METLKPYKDIPFKKALVWSVYTFFWISMIVLCIYKILTGYFDAVIDRTNIVAFYILCFAVFFLAYISLYKLIFKTVSSMLKICILSMANVIIIFVFFVSIAEIANGSFSKFSTDDWIKNVNERKYMVEDLIENTDIIGMDTESAELLLGKPDRKTDYNKWYYSRDYIIVFHTKNNIITGYDTLKK